MRKRITLFANILLLFFVVNGHAQNKGKKLKVYISADMEGIAGAVTEQQLMPAGFEYNRFREFMTEEVNATIRGAIKAGATEFVISDSHGNGQNLLIDKLPKNVLIVRSFPRPLSMMEGIDSTFDAAIFIGYHAGTANKEGVRAHTMSSGKLADVRLNGKAASEGMLNASIAGYYNVPVVMVSGDDAVVNETSAFIETIEGAIVKWAIGFHSAKTLTPQAAYELIEQKAERAIKRRMEIKPYVLPNPVQLDVRFKNYRPSEILTLLPTVERTDSHSIRFVGKDIMEVQHFLEFMLSYSSDLKP